MHFIPPPEIKLGTKEYELLQVPCSKLENNGQHESAVNLGENKLKLKSSPKESNLQDLVIRLQEGKSKEIKNLVKIAVVTQYHVTTSLNEIYGTKNSRMDQVIFFKGCLPQILLGPFLNTFSHMFTQANEITITEYCTII